MLSRLAAVASVFLSSSLLVSAGKMSEECVEKAGRFGNARIQSPRAYDHTDNIVAFLDDTYTPFRYTACVDANRDNRLVSVTFTYANAAGTKSVSMPRLGPIGGTCTTRKFEHRVFPSQFRVIQDD